MIGKQMEIPVELLLVRLLNFLRKEHLFTYIPARLLVENLHPDLRSKWVNNFIFDNYDSEKIPVYWQHYLYKSTEVGGEQEYRYCLIGSPLTMLREIWALWRISQEDSFKTHPAVFSYLWSSPLSHKIFSYHAEGYRKREEAVCETARGLSDPFVVVVDIKKFYPSIDNTVALRRFSRRLEDSTLTDSEKTVVLAVARGVCRKRKKEGLPIGLPLAHVIASVFLEKLDNTLEDNFAGRYFRYVDDMAVVVERQHVEAVIQIIGSILKKEGLELNHGKTDIAPAAVWKAHVNNKATLEKEATVASLISSLTSHLAHIPENFDQIKADFQESGISIPFITVKSVADYGYYRKVYSFLFKKFGFFFGKLDSGATLLRKAIFLRNSFVAKASEISKATTPTDGIQRRWFVQYCRFVFNRLLYLVPRLELSGVLEQIPDLVELDSTRILYTSIITGDLNELISFPGPTVLAFAQMWSESQTVKPVLDWTQYPKRPHRDSLLTLFLYDLCSPPEAWFDYFAMERDIFTLCSLRLALTGSVAARRFDNFSYMDEVQSLFLMNNKSLLGLLQTRYYEGEEITLPALAVSDESFGEFEDGSTY